MAYIFEDMDVYQQTIAIADKVISITRRFPRNERVLATQLKRAAISVSLNLAEGCGRWQKQDKKQFFAISRGSAYECIAAAELCRRQSFIDQAQHTELKAELDRVCRMLTTMIKSN